jgi:hypothetical protein
MCLYTHVFVAVCVCVCVCVCVSVCVCVAVCARKEISHVLSLTHSLTHTHTHSLSLRFLSTQPSVQENLVDAENLSLYGGTDVASSSVSSTEHHSTPVVGAVRSAEKTTVPKKVAKFTVRHLSTKHRKRQPITMLTAYDCPSAR